MIILDVVVIDVDMQGGNYPHCKECKAEAEETQNSILAQKSSTGTMTKVPLSECLLYEAFYQKCLQYGVPIPIRKVDHPVNHPRSWSLATCLGEGVLSNGDHDSWRSRVIQLSWEEQKSVLAS